MIFLAKVDDGASSLPAVVMDRVYVTDKTELGWSKLEGHFRYALQKAENMSVPLVVPDFLSPYYVQINEWAASNGFSAKETDIQVSIHPGHAGATYCELAGYNHYTDNVEIPIKALVLTKQS
jgi:hypothetical protein